MKGLISNQNGPKLEEILRLLAQSEAPTHVAFRGFNHTNTATINLKDGRLLNATCGDATGNQALGMLLSHDSWHFESFPELQSARADFSGDLDIGTQIVGMRAEMQAVKAEAEVGARRAHHFTMEGDQATGDLTPSQKQKLGEDYAFLAYYAREIGTSLHLGASKAVALCEADKSLALRSRGAQWAGVFTNRLSSISQILTEVA